MIKFREKLFFWGTALTVGSTALALGQGSKQMKESQKQAEQVERSNMAIAKQLNKIAKTNDPLKVQAAGQVMQQNFSIGTIAKTAGGFVKDLGTISLKNRKTLVNGMVMGATMAGSGYVADKIIQSAEKKRERTYSVATIAKTAIKKIPSVLKENKGSIMFGSALGAGIPLLSYGTNRLAENKMSKDMNSRNFSLTAVSSSVGRSLQTAGKKILGGLSSFSGGGGYKGVKNIGRQTWRTGLESGNVVTQKLGKAIIDHPNLAVAASIPVGGAILSGTFNAGDKAVRKTLKAVDKNAYKYQESQEQDIN